MASETQQQPPATSATHPLRVDLVQAPGGGWIGLTFCPGKKDLQSYSMKRGWDRDLSADVDALRGCKANVVVTLIEDHEFEMLKVEGLGDAVRAAGMAWFHVPIVDRQAPDGRFVAAWREVGPELHRRLDAGQTVVVHCRGGLGRAGTVAARLLIERGYRPDGAVEMVRACRRGTVETRAQEDYLLALGSPDPAPCEGRAWAAGRSRAATGKQRISNPFL
jgi:ADP-ribosyl-[dinitrogen reductase] hydrolase